MFDSASLVSAAVTLLIWGSATWIYWDATKNRIGKIPGKRGLFNNSAGAWSVLSLLLWIVVFPMYLKRRSALLELAATQPIEVKRRNLKLSILGVLTALGVVGSLGTSGEKPRPQLAQKKPAVVAQKAVAKPAAAPKPAASPAPAVASASAPQQKTGDEPEAVYLNFHNALMARNFDELRKWGVKKTGDEMAADPAAERNAMLGLMASMLPKSYTVAGKEISPDGSKATLHLRASVEDHGKQGTVLGTATLQKEGGAWKVDVSSWGGDQGAAPAPQAAASKPEKAAPAAPTVVAVAAAPMPAEAAPRRAPDPPAQATHAHSRAHEDARQCLELSTDAAIAACAEKFR